MNVGAFDFAAGRSPPIGTPFAYPVLTQSLLCRTPGAKSQPPKKRTLMRTPLVANVSLRCMAEDGLACVLLSPHPPNPDVANLSDVIPECFSPLESALRRGIEQGMATEEVRLRIRHRGAVRVARAHEAELVRVVPAPPASPARSGTPRGCSCHAVGAHDRLPPSRYSRISCRANSSLGDSAGCVDAPLSCCISDIVVHPGLRPRGIDRPALAVHFQRKHHAIGEVRVVRNGEQLVPGLALAIHPGPQILRMRGVHRGKRHGRNLLRILEDHVAVQVAIVGRRTPFVRGEGGERARFVELVGNVGDPPPDRACDLGADELLDRFVLEDGRGEEEIDLSGYRPCS